MTEIIVIRHGETDWNAERRMQGFIDIALNSAGQRQASLLATALQSEAFDRIIASDLQRAVATAQAIASPRGVPLLTDPQLRERCFGAFEGLRYDEINLHYPGEHAAWLARQVDARYPPGRHPAETLREFYARSVAAVIGHAQQNAGKRIAIVTHGGVLDCLYRCSTGMALEKQRAVEIRNASVNRFVWNGRDLQLTLWGDVAHLSQPALDEHLP